jgi:hypothetical protein
MLRLSEDGVDVLLEAATIIAALLPRLRATLESGETVVRTGLGHLDAGLRGLLDVDARPYGGPSSGRTTEEAGISYSGAR